MSKRRYAKIESDGTLVVTLASNVTQQELMSQDGFLPLVEEPKDEDVVLEPFQAWRQDAVEVDGQIISYWIVEDDAAELLEARVAELTAELVATDYKVIKNNEAAMAGSEYCYDPVDLYQERETVREAIRALESRLEHSHA